MLKLFLTFFRIGLFTFGGGYAMIPMIEGICVEQNRWITHEDMMNITVIAESTPGPVAINCATFVGYRKAGFWGAVAATLGVVLPSFAVICLIAMFLDNFLEIGVIANAFRGIKIGVGILIINAGWNMFKKLPKTTLCRDILACSLAAMLAIDYFSLNFSTISLMVMAGAVGVIAAGFQKGGDGE